VGKVQPREEARVVITLFQLLLPSPKKNQKPQMNLCPLAVVKTYLSANALLFFALLKKKQPAPSQRIGKKPVVTPRLCFSILTALPVLKVTGVNFLPLPTLILLII
jgi:hypothetical protein